jgi:predicted aspartyl protease
MGQVKVPVTLRNTREVVMARLGHLPADQVHTYETEALIDTGTLRSVLPPAVAEALGLVRMYRTAAQMADGRWGEADLTEPVEVTLVLGVPRVTPEPMLVMGEQVLLGAMALEGMDLVVDCARQRLVPNVGTWDQPVFRV